MDALVRKCKRLVVEGTKRGTCRPKKLLGRGYKTGYGSTTDYQEHDFR